MKRLLLLVGLGVGVFGVACAAGSGGNTGGTGGAGGSATSSKSSSSTSGTTISSTSSFMTGSTGTGIMGPAVVYGQSKDTLYKLDPNTKAVTTVGTFSGCTAVQDIALDKDSKLFATTLTGLYSIDKDTAACTLIAGNGSYPNSLSFVPAGTLDPNVEVLVGYVIDANMKNQYVRIDTQSGQVTNVGAPWAAGLVSSGDIVSVIAGPTYLTVKASGTATKCKTADCLVEVNPQNGAIVKDYGELATYKQIFGLAFWAGSVYGFDNAGDLFEVKIQGNAALTSPITVMPGLSFWGAGSTTAAPPVAN